MTRDEAEAATKDLIAGYGRKMSIAGKSRSVFVGPIVSSRSYDGDGAQTDEAEVDITGLESDLRDVRVGAICIDEDGRRWRVRSVDRIDGNVELRAVDASSK